MSKTKQTQQPEEWEVGLEELNMSNDDRIFQGMTPDLVQFIRIEIEAARREVLDTIFLRSCFVTEYTHLGRQTDYQRGIQEGESREKQALVKLLKQKYLTNDDDE